MIIDGVRQVYHVAGQGPVCVAHPGGPGLDWSYLRSPGLEEHFTMVYPAPVGTGGSGPVADYHLATYVRFLAGLIDGLGEDQVHLLGHSHGGFVTQQYALAHQERVAGLTLYSTSPYAGPDFWADGMRRLAAYPARHPDVPEAAEVPAAFQRALAARDDETITREFATALPVYFADFWSRRDAYEPFRAAVRMATAPATAPDPVVFDVRERLGELKVPTVVIAGRHDFLCAPGWTALLADGIPGAEVRWLEGSGHFGHVEQPEEFTEAVLTLR
ncbi:alpha/beta fold hydrolase [Symbioplanes lichenis]|uniref:alpha/beta fold hydrolase n=1 Tax=Symbioplanes lichenis TaxID=1629072 RepID=UPI002738B7E9|nr:alpha/beta hydrolase [Actinoplanes lichenis]